MTENLMNEAQLNEAAGRHLLLHFSEMSAYPDRPFPMMVRGEGAYVWDSAGRRYVDGLAGLYTVNVGHGRRAIADAVHRQLNSLEYFPLWNFVTPAAAQLAEKIAELAPGNLNRVFFTSGGSESVESAYKLVRQYQKLRGNPDKKKIISRTGAYHGMTLGALAICGLPGMQEPFQPLMPTVRHAPMVDSYHADTTPEQHALDCAQGVADVIAVEGPETVAAVIVEPLQNAAGCRPVEPVYYRRLREICDANDVMLISDETICSWGRTGGFFGSSVLGYQPDIITTAKALTSGYVPMGAVIVGDHVVEPFLAPGVVFEHGLTFGGHPAAAAAGLANIAVLEEENLSQRAVELGEYMQRGLSELLRLPIVGDVRGGGYFRAVELVADQGTKAPLPTEVLQRWSREITPALLERGVICRAMHRGSPIIQFAPTLVTSEADIDHMVSALGEVLEPMSAEFHSGSGAAQPVHSLTV